MHPSAGYYLVQNHAGDRQQIDAYELVYVGQQTTSSLKLDGMCMRGLTDDNCVSLILFNEP